MIKFPTKAVQVCTLARCRIVLIAGFGRICDLYPCLVIEELLFALIIINCVKVLLKFDNRTIQ